MGRNKHLRMSLIIVVGLGEPGARNVSLPSSARNVIAGTPLNGQVDHFRGTSA
jgi:hypothetical protein